jgi:hypothetical protein
MANKDNPKTGALFELAVGEFLATQGIHVRRNFPIAIGVGTLKRPRKFDLGSDQPKIVVECKSHSWTEGGNAPSAKMATWNEAMYYFSLVPADYRKMMFVLLSRFDPESETLLTYYIRRFAHLIPEGVEIWEFDTGLGIAQSVHAAQVK